MATITVQVSLVYTVSKLQGSTIDAILAWLQNNVTNQLPSGGTATIMFTNLTP